VLRVHAAGGAGVPLHDLRPGALAGLGRRRGVLASARPGAANPAGVVRGGAPRERRGAVAVRAGAGPAEQARAAVEPVDPAGPGRGVGRGPALLLRALRRPRRPPLHVHGRRPRHRRHRAPDLRRRGPPGPRAPAVPPRLRLPRVPRRRVRQARVGRPRHRRALRPLAQGPLVRPLRHPAHPAGQPLTSSPPLLQTQSTESYREHFANKRSKAYTTQRCTSVGEGLTDQTYRNCGRVSCLLLRSSVLVGIAALGHTATFRYTIV
jgi:hypothetical protein